MRSAESRTHRKLQALEKYAEAAPLYAAVLPTITAGKPAVYANLAVCLAKDASLDMALIGTKTSEFTSETFGNVGLAYLARGDVAKAESYLNKALGTTALETPLEQLEEHVDEADQKRREKNLAPMRRLFSFPCRARHRRRACGRFCAVRRRYPPHLW